MLLQGFYFSAEDLAKIANDLDNEELKVLSPEARVNFKSQNYDDTGFFSLQVIQVALQNLGFIVKPYDINNSKFISNGYICNFKEHWFAVRKLNGHWFILDSVREKPVYVSESYCDVFFAQLKAEGYSIFSVIGNFTPCPADNIEILDEKDDEKRNIEKAIQLSLKDNYNKQIVMENCDIQKAMEASLRDITDEKNSEDDLLLEEAIKLSLMEDNSDFDDSNKPCSTHKLKQIEQNFNLSSISSTCITSSNYKTSKNLTDNETEINFQSKTTNVQSKVDLNEKSSLNDRNSELREKRLKWLDKL